MAIWTITRSSNNPGDQPGRYRLDSVGARYGYERRLIGLMVKLRSVFFCFFCYLFFSIPCRSGQILGETTRLATAGQKKYEIAWNN